jgi:hypothetical protein
VTRDESQVSVGGLLALDQVLRKHWSCLTTFGTSTGWSKMEHPGGARSWDLTCFVGLWTQQRVFRVYVMGYGMSAHGFTHV